MDDYLVSEDGRPLTTESGERLIVKRKSPRWRLVTESGKRLTTQSGRRLLVERDLRVSAEFSDVDVELQDDGTLTVTWDGEFHNVGEFEILHRADGEETWQVVGTVSSSERSFNFPVETPGETKVIARTVSGQFISSSPVATDDADRDGNGLPDWWEMKHFGETGVDANADADGDGFTNLEEYEAGTDPNNYYERPDGNLNLAPVLKIGGNQTIVWPENEVQISAVASDPDNAPQPLMVTWSKVSGVGTVTFSNEHTSSPTATFSQIGTYVLKFTVSDGAVETAALMVVNVLEAPAALPTVRFVAPYDGAVMAWENDFTLWVKADDEGVPVATVDIYRNGVLIGTRAGNDIGSYLFTWNEATAAALRTGEPSFGAVTFTAVATSQSGAIASASVSVSFYPAQVGPPPAPNSGGGANNGGATGEFKNLTVPDAPLGFPPEFEVTTVDREEITEESEYTGEPGQVVLLEVVVTSAEYPNWTGQQSPFDDTAVWSVQPSWGDGASGSTQVNALHEKFNNDKEAIVGLYAVKFPSSIGSVERANPSINLKATVQNIADEKLDTTVSFRVVSYKITCDKSANSKHIPEFGENAPYNPAKHQPLQISDEQKPYLMENALVIHHNTVRKQNSEPDNIVDFDVNFKFSTEGSFPIQWTKISGPESGVLLDSDSANAIFRNPKKGGLYAFNLTALNTTTRAQIWLPKAGPDISAYWQNEINYFKNTWGPAYRARLDDRTWLLASKPIKRVLVQHILALTDMRNLGGHLDWHNPNNGQMITTNSSPQGGPQNKPGQE